MHERNRRRVLDRKVVLDLGNAIKEISNGSDVVFGALAWIKYFDNYSAMYLQGSLLYKQGKRADIRHIRLLVSGPFMSMFSRHLGKLLSGLKLTVEGRRAATFSGGG